MVDRGIARLAFLDIDGTILDERGVLAEGLADAARAARAAGVASIICTGRGRSGAAVDLAEMLAPDLPHVFHGGALVAHARGDALRALSLSREALAAILGARLPPGSCLELHSADEGAIGFDSPTARIHAAALGWRLRIEGPERFAERAAVLRAIIVAPAPEADTISIAPELDMAREVIFPSFLPGYALLCLSPIDSDKGGAARFLAGRLGVDIDACLAVGDAEADAPMLAAVGHPYLPRNASSALRRLVPRAIELEEGVPALLRSAARDGIDIDIPLD
jgi:HAD superfamily hydrolase (TIGR01484 family)